MTMDLEAIARRERCELSTLKFALPMLEQGYQPPFLTRYRRDEIGPVAEKTLWELAAAIREEQSLSQRRDDLAKKIEESQLDDPSLLASIEQAQTSRQLDRIARRIRSETGVAHPASRLAVRLLNPKPGDPTNLGELAELVVGKDHAAVAQEGLRSVLGQYLAADSRIVRAATAWMDRHVQLHIIDVHDPHEGSPDAPGESDNHEDSEGSIAGEAPDLSDREHEFEGTTPTPATVKHLDHPSAAEAPVGPVTLDQSTRQEESTSEESSLEARASATSAIEQSTPSGATDPVDGLAAVLDSSTAALDSPTAALEGPTAALEGPTAAIEGPTAGIEGPIASTEPSPELTDVAAGEVTIVVDFQNDSKASKPRRGGKGEKKPTETKQVDRKKISPRQRRRKWLVTVLEPLKGKALPKSKLTAFQVVMLGRALRSQVVQCAFKYNAGELIQVLARAASDLNTQASREMADIVLANEASIREAIEAAWWDDLIDRAARRLVRVASETLRRQISREPLESQVIMVIDAVGPRTAALAIVGPGGEVLHTEDVPCQLTKTFRQQLVTRLGELVHQCHVELIVLSNGPARRACMVALSELLAQSAGSSLRWTLAERAGAEIFAGGEEGNRELRSVPRRFRAAVWLAQLVRSPSRALAKIDVSRLRLGSYQRELADGLLARALNDVVTSGVCQVGVDVNSVDRGWLARLPGVTASVADRIDSRRRTSLLKNRRELLELDQWPSAVAQRQALGFLRVFGGDQPLDATAIHPDDYPLAERLLARLQIPMPPSAPSGYVPPNYSTEKDSPRTTSADKSGPQFTEVKIAAVDPDQPFGPAEIAAGTSPTEAIGESAADLDIEKASSDEPALAQHPSVTQDSVTQDSVTQDSATQDSVTQDSATQDSATQDSATQDSATQGSATQGSATQESAVEVPADGIAGGNTEQLPSLPVSANDSPSENQPSAPHPSTTPVVTYKYPLPDSASIARLVKEWQIGEQRVKHLIHSLCEPFSSNALEERSPSVAMARVPKLNELKSGELVSGVVVGVADFGVFVELGPDCSGLIHVSRLSEDFVEDLNEFVQIGDVVSAWVVEIDNKRRRVSLSGISPARQQALKAQDREFRSGDRTAHSEGRGGSGASRPPKGGSTGRHADSGSRGGAAGAGQRQGPPHQGQSSPGGARGGAAGDRPARAGSGNKSGGGGERPHGGSGDRSQGSSSRGQGTPGRGGRQGQSRRDGGRGPTSYTAVSRASTPVEPINDAKLSGEEPLRSFGELMQFFKGARTESTPKTESSAASSKSSGNVSQETSQVAGTSQLAGTSQDAELRADGAQSHSPPPTLAGNPVLEVQASTATTKTASTGDPTGELAGDSSVAGEAQ